MDAPYIDALHVYPVKGCRGLSPERADAEVTGFATLGVGDREWMVIDSQARFVTQREFPQLALIEVSLAGETLGLTTPGFSPLLIPLAGAPHNAREVRVWRSVVRGVDEGDLAAGWLSRALGATVRLVRFDRRNRDTATPISPAPSAPTHCSPTASRCS